MFKINTDRYLPAQFYRRNQMKAFRCLSRNKFIKKNPEELIRQAFLSYLIKELNVPIESIEIEVPLTRFKKGAKGRADIVIYANNGKCEPICLIECKDKNIPFVDKVYEQVYNYHDFILSNIVMITDGMRLEVLFWDKSKGEFKIVTKVPSYADMMMQNNLIFENYVYEPWTRPAFEKHLSKDVIEEFYEEHIGVDTPTEYYPFIINFSGLIYDVTEEVKPSKDFFGINLIEDGGIREASFGNNAGGSYSGPFRYFIVEDKSGDHQIISLAVMANMKTVNDKRFGNNRGRTTFIVAIDDFEISHNSLQLTIEDNILLKNHKALMFHNGSMSVSNLGSVPRKLVIDYVQKIFPELINGSDNKIVLGEFDLTRNIEWNDYETQRFLSNVIKYCIARDLLRRQIKQGKTKKSYN